MLTIQNLLNPKRLSGYDYVAFNRTQKSAWYRGQVYDPNLGRQFYLPARATGAEAAQDVCDYRNGQQVLVKAHTGHSGRPDFYKDEHGVLHIDLPAEPGHPFGETTKAKPKPRERELMQRMVGVVARQLNPQDLCEAKASCGRQAIVTGVGQLLLGRHEIGKPGKNYLLLPRMPKDKGILGWLTSLNVEVLHP